MNFFPPNFKVGLDLLKTDFHLRIKIDKKHITRDVNGVLKPGGNRYNKPALVVLSKIFFRERKKNL